MTRELKPCPFCGGEDIDEYEGDYGNGVYCMSCGAMMGEQIHKHDFHYDGGRVSYEHARDAWNTRAVEIVRCRDCIYYDDYLGSCVRGNAHQVRAAEPDGFCKWGERK